MMTFEEIRDHVAKISYKPGWYFEVRQHRGLGVVVQVLAVVKNTYRPDELTTFGGPVYVEYMHTPDQLDHAIRQHLHRMEIHEADEWFKRDGKPIFDPHDTPETRAQAKAMTVADLQRKTKAYETRGSEVRFQVTDEATGKLTDAADRWERTSSDEIIKQLMEGTIRADTFQRAIAADLAAKGPFKIVRLV